MIANLITSLSTYLYSVGVVRKNFFRAGRCLKISRMVIVVPRELQPGYFINLKINPEETDVNIHPRKLEVKIDNLQEVFKQLRNAVQKTLEINSQHKLKEKFESFSKADRLSDSKPFVYNKQEIKSNQQSPTQPKFEYNINSKQSISTTPKTFSTQRENNSDGFHTPKQGIEFTQSLLTEDRQSEYNHFQLFNTYIVIQKHDSVELIDQHAADERINYEKIIENTKNNNHIEKQNLLIPITLILSHESINIIGNSIEKLSEIGLDIDIFGEDKIKINAIPTFAREINHKELIDEIIQTFHTIEEGNIDEINHQLAASIACHGSIRAGCKLRSIEIEKLIDDLAKCKQPHSCPHGRPIIWSLKKSEIEKKFKRIK